jgi:uncharacterized protein YjbI with pentapeptide repeats
MAGAEAGVSTAVADFMAADLVGFTGVDFTPADFMAAGFTGADFTPARFMAAGSTMVTRACTMVSATGTGLTGTMAGATGSTAGFGVTG